MTEMVFLWAVVEADIHRSENNKDVIFIYMCSYLEIIAGFLNLGRKVTQGSERTSDRLIILKCIFELFLCLISY